MMPATTGITPKRGDRLEPELGSSTAKVLADYAAMSASKHNDPNSTPSLLVGESGGQGREEGAVRSLSPFAPALYHEGRECQTKPREIGGRDGPEPTRFGDWEKSGRCIDF
jgi:hypothetical protein